MARENQGLQIALIIFVMLTIVLGVTTYLCYRNYDDAAKAKALAEATAGKNDNQAKVNEEHATELKKLIGVAATESVDSIKEIQKKDMEKYGAAYPEEDRFYRRMLEKMQRTIDEKNAELREVQDRIPKLQDEHKARDEEKDEQLKQFQASREKAANDLASEQAKYENERARSLRDQTKLQSDLQAERKKGAEMVAKIESKFQETEKNRLKLVEVAGRQGEKIERYESGILSGAANGEVTWVNQRNATVWINLGRADGLLRQVTFSVYPADVTDMKAKGARKAKIEVTQILGNHLAEARVTEDEIGRPILPSDKIYTPLWSPGERRHFALAGLIDVDGDGRSDLETVKNLIAINGGVVDCFINDAGKQEGEITVNTNCLVLGDAPTDKEGDARQIASFTKLLRDADQLRLQKVQLSDLLQQMGWKNMSPVVRYGRGSNPKDFRAQPPAGVPKKSSGNVSDVFEKRQLPKAPASAF
jgi:hypothetical protein